MSPSVSSAICHLVALALPRALRRRADRLPAHAAERVVRLEQHERSSHRSLPARPALRPAGHRAAGRRRHARRLPLSRRRRRDPSGRGHDQRRHDRPHAAEGRQRGRGLAACLLTEEARRAHLTVSATQSDGQRVSANGNFEIVALERNGKPAKNIIILLGDGMGASQRTAARIMGHGYAQGKAQSPLAMDTFPVTGMVMTSSLDGIVTDSSPGMSNYVTGNKSANNTEGVFPDDTADAFDNPRIEYLSEYLHRTQGKALGIVTTADVFDATPAAMAVHTSQPRLRHRHRRPVPRRPRPHRPDGADGRRTQVVPAQWRQAQGQRRARRPADERLAARRAQRLRVAFRPGRRLGRRARRQGCRPRPDQGLRGRRLRVRARQGRPRRGGIGQQAARPVLVLEHERRVRQDQQAPRHLDHRRRLRLPRPADARRDGRRRAERAGQAQARALSR